MSLQQYSPADMIKLPFPFSAFPREKLLYPQFSPIEPLLRLSGKLNQSVRSDKGTKFWIKREDSNSGLAYGGNKVRKLEYIIPDALKKGATILVTTGGMQSNSMRQVTAAGARFGLKTHLISTTKVKSPDPEYKQLGNIQMTDLMSATRSAPDSKTEEVMKACSSKGEVPYWIPAGASMHPLGGLGFARFAFEVVEQEKQMGVHFDSIIIPCAGGSTFAGMVAGFKLLEKTARTDSKDGNNKNRQLIGVDTFAADHAKTEAKVLKIAKATGSLIGLTEEDIKESDFEVDMRWNAGAYGYVNDGTQEAMKLLATTEGILTDPVYTGKALAGLVHKARLGDFNGNNHVLFVHTGGSPALSAYPNVR